MAKVQSRDEPVSRARILVRANGRALVNPMYRLRGQTRWDTTVTRTATRGRFLELLQKELIKFRVVGRPSTSQCRGVPPMMTRLTLFFVR